MGNKKTKELSNDFTFNFVSNNKEMKVTIPSSQVLKLGRLFVKFLKKNKFNVKVKEK